MTRIPTSPARSACNPARAIILSHKPFHPANTMTIIAAITDDNGLGRAGDMLYHISADLRRFKALTMGHPLVMGRKTFDSLPGGALPGRRNLVITRNPAFTAPGIETFSSLKAALAAAADPFVIGGGQIYAQAMPFADTLEITHIHTLAPDADTRFPAIDPAVWRPVSEDGPHNDPRTGATFTFVTYRRR